MKKAIYTQKYVLTCPYCKFQKPENDGDMPEQVDIVSMKVDTYLCGSCGQEFKQ